MGNKSKTLAFVFALLFAMSVVMLPHGIVKGQTRTLVVPDQYPTIQSALDNASAGDTVFVRHGIYNVTGYSALTINKPLSLVGEDRDNTVLQGVDWYAWSHGVIYMKADNVSVSGFTINGNAIMEGIYLEGSNCTISNTTVKNCDIGIEMSGNGHQNTVSNNLIVFNIFYGLLDLSYDSTIVGNNITQNQGTGLELNAQNIVVNQNEISHNGLAQKGFGGLNLRSLGNYRVFQNNITDNLGFGVQFDEGCNQSLVYNNNIVENQRGINLANFVTDTVGLGFGNVVYNNNLVNNSVNAYVEEAYPYSNINYANNRTDVVMWDNGKVGNYWSDYKGEGNYTIDPNNIDLHPLTHEIIVPEFPALLSITVLVMTALAAIVVVGKKHSKER